MSQLENRKLSASLVVGHDKRRSNARRTGLAAIGPLRSWLAALQLDRWDEILADLHGCPTVE